MTPEFAPDSDSALPLWLVWSNDPLPDAVGSWPNATGFRAKAGQICLIPDTTSGTLKGAIMGLGSRDHASRQRFHLARAHALPAKDWVLANHPEGLNPDDLALGWLLGQYRFDRYHSAANAQDGLQVGPRLVCPAGVDAAKLVAIATGEFLTRDLINTPSNDMGPEQLEAAAHDLADRLGARMQVICGEDLLEKNFPLIHAVGRASARAPRLIDIRVGHQGPKVTVIGKGVCFDTGGLNLKPGASMGLMKKDMGGAATALGFLHMWAQTGMRDAVQLRILIPAVENSVSGTAFRPGDVLISRTGLSVEVNNTDAEGRLVLADAMAYAGEENPDVMITLATLTGAARVAMGPDVVPFYCDDDASAQTLYQAGVQVGDPIWRLPFWDPYESQIEPNIADLDNAPSGGMAGSITAALFLRRFATGAKCYAHFDMYGWQPNAAPGRPAGGVGQAARAILAALPKII